MAKYNETNNHKTIFRISKEAKEKFNNLTTDIKTGVDVLKGKSVDLYQGVKNEVTNAALEIKGSFNDTFGDAINDELNKQIAAAKIIKEEKEEIINNQPLTFDTHEERSDSEDAVAMAQSDLERVEKKIFRLESKGLAVYSIPMVMLQVLIEKGNKKFDFSIDLPEVSTMNDFELPSPDSIGFQNFSPELTFDEMYVNLSPEQQIYIRELQDEYKLISVEIEKIKLANDLNSNAKEKYLTERQFAILKEIDAVKHSDLQKKAPARA